MKPVDSLHIATDRIPEPMRSKRGAIGRPSAVATAIYELWQDEWDSFHALNRMGLHAAAECAWQRRCAAAEAYLFLAAAM